jgi:hypothetical protein
LRMTTKADPIRRPMTVRSRMAVAAASRTGVVAVAGIGKTTYRPKIAFLDRYGGITG